MVLPDAKTEKLLWCDYHQKGDQVARARLIETYAPLIKYVSGRLALFVPPTIEPDDLVGYGAIGLIQAIDGYDPSRGIKFATYALARIRGAMLDGMRQSDWLPRSLRQKERQLREAYQKVSNKLGHSATDMEIAAELNLDKREFQQLLLEVGQLAVISLNEIFPGRGEIEGSPDMVPAPRASEPLQAVVQSEIKNMIAAAINKLPQKERLVIALYYYDGFTQREVAEVLGVSESRVSQLHTKAILRLRGRLGSRKKDLGVS